MVLLRIVPVGIHAHDDRDVRVGRRSGDDDFAGSRSQVLGGVLALGEQTGALRDNVHSHGLPVDFFGIPHRTNGNGLSADFDDVAFSGNLNIHGSVNRIVFQQMRHGFGVREIVDGDYLDFRVLRRRSEQQPSNSAKSVDANLDCHRPSLED